MTVQTPPTEAGAAGHEAEMQIMQAIVGNCTALGVAPEEAKHMAIRSILNLRRARSVA